MDNSDFILSKLDTAIASARSIDLGSFLTSVIFGLATVLLALAAILPTSFLAFVRILLLVATGATILVLYWVLRRLVRSRAKRLGILRKWHEEVFFSRDRVDSLGQPEMRKLIELVQFIEDTHFSSSPRYDRVDTEFMSMLK